MTRVLDFSSTPTEKTLDAQKAEIERAWDNWSHGEYKRRVKAMPRKVKPTYKYGARVKAYKKIVVEEVVMTVDAKDYSDAQDKMFVHARSEFADHLREGGTFEITYLTRKD